MEGAIREFVNQAGRIDILVNNAGMNIRTPALEVTDSEWDLIVQTNLKSAFVARLIYERSGQWKNHQHLFRRRTHGSSHRRCLWFNEGGSHPYDQGACDGVGAVWNSG